MTQARIDEKTGEITDDDPLGLEDDGSLDEMPTRESQAKIVAELTGIVMKPSQRVFALKVVAENMREELLRVYREQKGFMLKFRVPVEKMNGKVRSWKTVEFPTRLSDITLKNGKLTCHGHIDHEGACVMSELIQHWNSGMEFFLDGMQQSMM